MIELLADQQFSVASYIAADIDDKLAHRIAVLQANAEEISSRHLTTPAELRGYLSTRAGLSLLFKAGVAVVSKDGTGIADYPSAPERVGATFGEIEYFKEVMKTGKPAIGRPRIGRFTKHPGVAIAVPLLTAAGGVDGLLVGFATLSDSTLFGQVEHASFGKSGYVAIDAPQYQMIVTSSDTARTLTPMAAPGVNPMVDRFVAGFEGSGIAVNSRRIETLTSGKRIPSAGWIVQIVLPTSEAFAPIREMKGIAYGVSAGLAVLVSMVMWLIIRWTLRPLGQAVAAVNDMVTGKTELTEIPVSSHDEIGTLIAGFNQLIDQRRTLEGTLRQRKEVFQAILLSITESIFLLDRNCNVIAVNPAGAHRMGKTPENLIGRDVLAFVPSEIAKSRRANVDQVFQTGLPHTYEDSRAGRTYSSSHYPVFDGGGSVESVVIVATDITDRRIAEDALRRAMDDATSQAAKAEAASRAKSEFLANMSHEIRTPMNAILGLTHLLEREDLSAFQRDYVAKIKLAGRSLLSIINDILDFSKVEAGRLELEKSEFRISDLMDILATIMTINAGSKDLELIIRVVTGVPAVAIGDALRLQQILINLVGNAIKFTEAGEIVVEVSREGEIGGQVVLRFQVSDTGIGIPADKVGSIFDAFCQADNSTTRKFGGTGLGLAISKRLVDLMGGRIGVTSEPGRGSTFQVTVPLDLVAPSGAVPDGLAGISVLIADDHDVARQVMADIAQGLNWRARAVASGREALDILAGKEEFDVVLLDWKMPDLDGLAVSRAIRSDGDRGAGPLLFLVTAANREEVLRKAGLPVVDGILVKPLTATALVTAVREARNRRANPGSRPEASASAGGRRLAGLHILVVEDNTINQDVARRVLELEGASVSVAGDGSQALTMLTAMPKAFDVVLMDIQMPVMDGYEATTRLRKDLGLVDLPVIALTAGALSADQSQARAVGMNDFIAKPFDVDAMVQRIRALVTIPEAAVASASGPDTPDESFPEIAGIQARGALIRLGGDAALFRSLLSRLVEQYGDAVSRIRADLGTGQTEQAARLLHTLRGAAGNIAAVEVASAASAVEAAIKDDEKTAIPPGLDRLERALGTLVAAIRETVGTVSATPPVPAGGTSTIQDLRAALTDRSLSALEHFANLRGSLAPAVAAEIASCLDRLDFAAAAALVTQLER